MQIRSMQSGMFVHRQNVIHQASMAKSLERLASGFKINRAADDASGLAVSQKMRAQLSYLEAQQSTLSMSRSSLETKDGTLSGVHDLLNRMVELSTKAMSDDISIDRYALNAEYQQLLSELERLAEVSSSQNTVKLYELSGTMTQDTITISGGNIAAFIEGVDDYRLSLVDLYDPAEVDQHLLDYITEHGRYLLQTPDDSGSSLSYTLTISSGGVSLTASAASPAVLGLGGTDLLSKENAGQALDAVKSAINKVSLIRSDIGATLSRLQSRESYAALQLENMLSALSRIEDADMAEEMMNFVREQVLTEVSAALMAHINQDAYRILALLEF